MELQLEDLAYQREAIDAVIRLFEGQPRNTFDMACHEGVRSNVLTIPSTQVRENLAALEAYIRDREAAFLMTFDQKDILAEVLLKNGFMLDVETEAIADFTENAFYRAWDSRKEATVCLDYDLKEQTVAKLKGIDGIFICLEQALNTTKKWNLRAELGERLVAF
jgi:adenine-specific DNA-methyltransferase